MKTFVKNCGTLLLAFFTSFPGYQVSIAAEDTAGPLLGWETVVVAPLAKISMPGGNYTDSDAEEAVERFLRILEDRGVRSRKATPKDERFLVLSMRVLIGPDSPFLLRLQHKESVRYLRNGEEVGGIASTWESETLSNYGILSSTPWPAIEKAMEIMTDDLAAAVHGHPNKTTAEQDDDAN